MPKSNKNMVYNQLEDIMKIDKKCKNVSKHFINSSEK